MTFRPETVHASRIWRDGVLVGTDVDPDTLHAAATSARRGGDELVWIDLVAPDATVLGEIGRALELRDTALEDALGVEERPKLSRHDGYLFFTTSATALVDESVQTAGDHGRLTSSRVSGFVLPGVLMTVRLDDTLDMAPVVEAWQENAHLLRCGTRALVHGLLDVVVDGYFTTIQSLDDDIEALEDRLFEDRASDAREFLRDVYGLRKDLVALRRVVLPMREVVNGLLRHRDIGADSSAAERTDLDSWFDDLYDHVLRAAEWTESLRDMVTSVFETNLSLQDSRLNVIMKKLAAWAAVIAWPTFVTGWFGQNVPYPGFSAMSGFWQTVAFCFGGTVLLYVLFRRQDWL